MTGRPNPSCETKFSGANVDREIFIFPVQLTTSRIVSLTWLIQTLLHVMTITQNMLLIIKNQVSAKRGNCVADFRRDTSTKNTTKIVPIFGV